MRRASDFQAACSRARVGSTAEPDPLAVGSPPVKSSLDDVITHKNKSADDLPLSGNTSTVYKKSLKGVKYVEGQSLLYVDVMFL